MIDDFENKFEINTEQAEKLRKFLLDIGSAFGTAYTNLCYATTMLRQSFDNFYDNIKADSKLMYEFEKFARKERSRMRYERMMARKRHGKT